MYRYELTKIQFLDLASGCVLSTSDTPIEQARSSSLIGLLNIASTEVNRYGVIGGKRTEPTLRNAPFP